jgi:16S rRNA (cytidine1402-2'-O)-methyltransferase
MGKLILVGTPIGNPHDMSIRMFNYIKQAKNIIAENPKDFNILLNTLGLDKSDANVMFAHTWPEYIGDEVLVSQTIKLLKSGEDVYVVCDAGMPAVADPGSILIKECIKENIPVISTPGPSAVTVASTITGCGNEFYFGGFISKDRSSRNLQLAKLSYNHMPNLFVLVNDQTYVDEVFQDLIKIWGDRKGALCYNLTTSKEYTTFGRLSELQKHYLDSYYGEDQVMIVIDGLDETL